MIALDGTENKSGLGANAMLAASLAMRACRRRDRVPLFRHLGGERDLR
jgi:enolase